MLSATPGTIVSMRILGRWLWYTFVGLFFLLALWGAGEIHGEEPTNWRSILLSFGGLLCLLAGLAVWWFHASGGKPGHEWLAFASPMWFLSACLTVGAWFSIARDLRAEKKR